MLETSLFQIADSERVYVCRFVDYKMEHRHLWNVPIMVISIDHFYWVTVEEHPFEQLLINP